MPTEHVLRLLPEAVCPRDLCAPLAAADTETLDGRFQTQAVPESGIGLDVVVVEGFRNRCDRLIGAALNGFPARHL